MPATVIPVKGVFRDGSLPVNQVPQCQPVHVGLGMDSDVKLTLLSSSGAAVNLSSGPSGTGTGITDGNTAAWNYIEALGTPAAWATGVKAANALCTANGGTWITPAGGTSSGSASFPAPAIGATYTDPGGVVWYCVTAWAPSTSYSSTTADYVSANGNVYQLATAGTSGVNVACKLSVQQYPDDPAPLFTVTGTVESPGTGGIVDCNVSEANTTAIGSGTFVYDVTVTFGDGKKALVVPASPFVIDAAF